MIKINILGATGSIGDSTLNVIRDHSSYKINAITGGQNVVKLANIAKEFNPKIVAIADESKYLELKSLLSGTNIELLAGDEGIIQAASTKNDITLSAIVGLAALKPTLAAIPHSKKIALANKESLVCGGAFLLNEAKKHNVRIIPVDSEHNAIFQVFESHNVNNVDKITITASGGAFRDLTITQMANATPAMALKHPNWNMGAKITIDCATLANKGLEYIEACILFSMKSDQVDILVHPQSIVHGMVHYNDGSVLALLSNPDMRTSIANALAYPLRMNIIHKPLQLADIGNLSFSMPDYKRFPMLKLAMECFNMDQNALITYNTANEIAVNAFLEEKINFLDIHRLVKHCVHNRSKILLNDINNIYDYSLIVQQQAFKTISDKTY